MEQRRRTRKKCDKGKKAHQKEKSYNEEEKGMIKKAIQYDKITAVENKGRQRQKYTCITRGNTCKQVSQRNMYNREEKQITG